MGFQMIAFRRRAAKDFLGLVFNLQVPDEEEAEESVSEDEADPEVFSDAPTSVPLPSEAEIPTEAGSSPLFVGALPSDTHDLEVRTTEA